MRRIQPINILNLFIFPMSFIYDMVTWKTTPIDSFLMYLQINFPWSEIRRISYSGDKFIVKLTTKATPKFIAQVLHRLTTQNPWIFNIWWGIFYPNLWWKVEGGWNMSQFFLFAKRIEKVLRICNFFWVVVLGIFLSSDGGRGYMCSLLK